MTYLLFIAQCNGSHQDVKTLRKETKDTTIQWIGALDNLNFHKITKVFNLCFGQY